MNETKVYAQQLTSELHVKAQQQAESAEIKKITGRQIAAIMCGNKTERLVFRFIGNLRKAVKKRKDKYTQKSNE